MQKIADQDKIFTGDCWRERTFVSGPRTSPNKSKMVDGSHIELRKVIICLYWLKVCAPSLVQTCNTVETTDNIWKMAFSLHCSRERSDNYNF